MYYALKGKNPLFLEVPVLVLISTDLYNVLISVAHYIFISLYFRRSILFRLAFTVPTDQLSG